MVFIFIPHHINLFLNLVSSHDIFIVSVAVDVIVHIMTPAMRRFYHLEDTGTVVTMLSCCHVVVII